MITVVEGSWEEIARRAPEFIGRRLRLLVLDREATSPANNQGASGEPSDEETQSRIQSFLEWADSHPMDRPPLSDYAISRESIYSEDEE